MITPPLFPWNLEEGLREQLWKRDSFLRDQFLPLPPPQCRLTIYNFWMDGMPLEVRLAPAQIVFGNRKLPFTESDHESPRVSSSTPFFLRLA